jgi:hypothetical protein
MMHGSKNHDKKNIADPISFSKNTIKKMQVKIYFSRKTPSLPSGFSSIFCLTPKEI